ncbi:hypothetical protein F7725_007427 [Dissostichus mawsoni]|uniref:Ig-like domain-containing protein n=1 Tax=Dissostichus mawsoni TaxID=36200 RepID=A0A7J5XWR6_DISMA|nr:hypothetical protein F7725_007427 [Dissostichus mawsoni]
MESSQSIVVVSYLDLSLTPSGTVRKAIGDSFSVKVEQSASGEANVSWTKNGQEVRQPEFNRLTYADAGVYVCELSMPSMPGLTRRRSFEMMVEGKPEITGLNKHRPDGASYKVLTCEATGEESSYINGKATHKIRVIPKLNLTVTCSVSNRLGDNTLTINVSSVFKEEEKKKEKSEDQSKLIVGGVAGLLIAAAVVGLVYWLYMKNSRQGSWKTGEKEVGTSEESKTLEENHPTKQLKQLFNSKDQTPPPPLFLCALKLLSYCSLVFLVHANGFVPLWLTLKHFIVSVSLQLLNTVSLPFALCQDRCDVKQSVSSTTGTGLSFQCRQPYFEIFEQKHCASPRRLSSVIILEKLQNIISSSFDSQHSCRKMRGGNE